MARQSVHVRLPAALHAELIVKADEQNISLNTLIVALLAGAIGWKESS